MKPKYILLIACVLFITFTQCKKVLDKSDLSAIDGETISVWSDEKLATAYVNALSASNLPGWDAFASSKSDESSGSNNPILFGQLTSNSVTEFAGAYVNIRNINLLLANIDQGTLTQSLKNSLKGQAYFFRAYRYFELVKQYGGVPLVLEPQSRDNQAALNVGRNKTSECITQIISDLDQAITLLPRKWTGIDYGRISRAAALAYKGRVLLYYASPQFNPTNIANRWENAYLANKNAKDSLTAYGFGLQDDFSSIWLQEGDANKEVIFGRRYNDPGATQSRDACVRPLSESANCNGGSQPSIEMVNAFPMKNGLAIDDPSSGYDASNFWKNRDPRFDATIVYNGVLYELSGKSGRKQWTYSGGELSSPSETGFYSKKAINVRLTASESTRSGTDWVDLRFAEVLLNLAECANETGRSSATYTELQAVRKRAGIEPGGQNLYGLKSGMSKVELTNALMLERKIEFAFEDKRYWDLRRRKLFETELNGKSRHKVVYTLKNISQDDFLKIRDQLNLDGKYDTYFKTDIVELDATIKINFKPEYYFFAIPQSDLQLNPNLKQTMGWDGGTFNPLD